MVKIKTSYQIACVQINMLDKGLNIKNSKKYRNFDKELWISFNDVKRVVLKHKGHGDCIDKIIEELKL